ncbi:MAG: hypothetical protein AAF202_04955, partial [Pseudomonadota bacterium]
EEWVFSRLRNGKGPAWLLTGSQWFGGYLEKEAYEWLYPESFEAFVERLKGSGRYISFVSGDVHFSEVMDLEPELLGYPSIEITTSSLHSLTVAGWHRLFRNPRRQVSTSRHNFVLLNLELNADGQSELIQCFGKGRSPAFEVKRELAEDQQAQISY